MESVNARKISQARIAPKRLVLMIAAETVTAKMEFAIAIGISLMTIAQRRNVTKTATTKETA